MYYRIAQNFGGVNVWRMKLKMHLAGNILAVDQVATDLLQRHTREQCNAREWQCLRV